MIRTLPLSVTHPELCKDWDVEKNALSPEKVSYHSKKRAAWKCHRCGRGWTTIIGKRTRGDKTGSFTPCECLKKLVSYPKSLAKHYPNISNQWHPSLNPRWWKPTNISPNSHRQIWWRCPVDYTHVWQAQVKKRTKEKRGCPFCAGRQINKSNCLATTHPKIASEWHPLRNDSITPEMVGYGSTKRVWWKCLCGHEWKATPNGRTANNTGCPRCKHSKGENCVESLIQRLGLTYKTQFRIPSCRHKRPLPFDFAIFDKNHNLTVLIEYQGEHHYQPIPFNGDFETAKESFTSTQRNDGIKKQYCLGKGIKFLEIPFYWKPDEIARELAMLVGR